VDGAHVPGHIALNLNEIEADIYTGACHKWMMTPKGSSFLYVKKPFQATLDPLIISWGYDEKSTSDSKYFDYHQFNGTRDFTAFLSVPKAIEFMDKYKWETQSAWCKEKVLEHAPPLFNLLRTNSLAPLDTLFYGQMCSAKIQTGNPEKLQRLLFEKYRIEIPIMRHLSDCYIRFSFQVFNTDEDLDNLVKALTDISKNTNLIEL
jgi:isopenicillin-N epimerase